MLSTSFAGLSSAISGGLSALLAAIMAALLSFSPLSSSGPTEPAPAPAPGSFPVGDQAHGGFPVPWHSAEIMDQHTIQIRFSGTTRDCGRYRLEVSETETSVVIGLYSRSLAPGQLPPVYETTEDEVRAQKCPDIAILHPVDLTTEAPVGDRAIVDAYELD